MKPDDLRSLLQPVSPFRSFESYKKLKTLLEALPEFCRLGELIPQRLKNFVGRACGFKLLFGTERITEDILNGLVDLANETHAIEKMKKLQAGETMNFVEVWPSENRPALHTALRDQFDHMQTSKAAKKAAQLAKKELDKLKAYIEQIDKEKNFDTLVTIGIGGSDLGPRAHYFALEPLLKKGRSVHFVSNVDPDDITAVLKKVNLKTTLVVVISKSGTTLETQTNEAFFREKFKEAKIDPAKHFISITMPGTPMDNSKIYDQVFYVWDWVGGRYSTTSVVGGFMLSFAFGYDVFLELLRGAHDMDVAALESDVKKNLPLLSALIGVWNHNFLGYSTLAIIPYSEALKRFPAHLQQLDMESNGKLLDQNGKFSTIQTGPVIWGEPGTNAQHSFFQLLHQGTVTVPVTFIGFKKSQYGEDLEVQGTTSQEKFLANLFAQSLALALGNKPENPNQFCPGNRPNHILLAEQLTPYSLGALLSLFENKVAFQGFIWGINSFDQEGVQLGKTTANQLISLFAEKRKPSKKPTENPLASEYLKHLDNF